MCVQRLFRDIGLRRPRSFSLSLFSTFCLPRGYLRSTKIAKIPKRDLHFASMGIVVVPLLVLSSNACDPGWSESELKFISSIPHNCFSKAVIPVKTRQSLGKSLDLKFICLFIHLFFCSKVKLEPNLT